MATKIGINGFGRIGRLTLRTLYQYHKDALEVVAVNDLADAKTNAHLLKWDSNYGQFAGKVEAKDSSIIVDGKSMKILAEKDPAKIPWKDYGVDIVIESTGLFTDGPKAAGHLQGGAKKVLISAPAKGEDITLLLGVNEDKYDPSKHHIISNASCTTNGIAPLVKILHREVGISRGLMTTVHAFTNDQRVQDMFHSDLRRARAASESIIPTTTGAARMLGEIFPDLKGKLHGLALRVPTPTVSVIDFVVTVNKSVTVEQVNAMFQTAAAGELKGILEYCTEPLVSVDFKGNTHSSIYDSLSTMVLAGDMVKILAWYDNEWGYSCRLADLAALVARKGV